MRESVIDSSFIIGCMRLGAWGEKLDTEGYERFIKGCLDIGLNTFDHADIYGDHSTEEEFGKVLKSQSALRHEIRLITKCGIKRPDANRSHYRLKSYDSGAEHIRWSVENSLKVLCTDRIDLLLLHRPDYLMDPAEVAEVFTELKEEGKVLAFGVSNFSTSQFELLDRMFSLETNQIACSLLQRTALEDGTLDQCLMKGIRPQAWSPLGGGELFSPTGEEPFQRINKVCLQLESELDCSRDQLLLAWLRKHPAGIIPVLGTSKTSRLKAAMESADLAMSREQWYMLLEAATGQKVL